MLNVAGISRIRIDIDGEGLRTLVVMQGCPLRCQFCINPRTWRGERKAHMYTPKDLFEKVDFDRIYYKATGGGITVGGGEPLLQIDELSEFVGYINNEYTVYTETSLNVPQEVVKKSINCFDKFIVDIKAVNEAKYIDYTGKSNAQVLKNLEYILGTIGPERIVIRIPSIPGIIDETEQKRECEFFQSMGLRIFDLFTYRVN